MAEARARLCVVGTQTGTQVLKDGQDGGKGIVRIED
jgi:hypothetical protein